MKKYIAPSINIEQLQSTALLTGSIHNEVSTSPILSREHEDFTFEDED